MNTQYHHPWHFNKIIPTANLFQQNLAAWYFYYTDVKETIYVSNVILAQSLLIIVHFGKLQLQLRKRRRKRLGSVIFCGTIRI